MKREHLSDLKESIFICHFTKFINFKIIKAVFTLVFAKNTSIQIGFDRDRLNTHKAFPCLLFFFLFGSILESFSGFLSRIGVGEYS